MMLFFAVGGLVFCFLPLFFCRQKLFTIAAMTITIAPKKVYNLLIYSVLLCLFSVLVIHNWLFINNFNSVSLYKYNYYFCVSFETQ